MRIVGIFLSILVCTNNLCAQSTKEEVYHVNWWLDGGITLATGIANYAGLALATSKPKMDSAEVLMLDPMDVFAFDRPATRVSPDFAPTADAISDNMLFGSFFLPGLLAIDPKVRKDIWKVYMLYLQAGFSAGTIYSWGAAIHVDRIRPIAYNEQETLERRLSGDSKNSFYSGHVAQAAVATFFMAKVLSDYHPEWNNKWMLYGGAAIIPGTIGYLRYRAGRHFPTDIILGFGIGAAVGILIPEIHRHKPDKKLSVLPYSGNGHGIAMQVRF